MSLGVRVRPSIILDKGTRKPDGRYDRIKATGDSSGIAAGTRLTPYVRYQGQATFAQGKAVITVASDGTFTWSRKIRANRGLTAYVSWKDTESNRVYWAKIR